MSCEGVNIVGNTFRNGGRGSWINQPRNFVLADNIFANNPTKSGPDPRRGRRSFVTGGDTVLVTDNIFAGPVRDIAPMTGCENVTIRNNVGLPHQP